LWKKKFKKEHEEVETMENVNRLLLENVLPAHVAAHFIGDKLNEVCGKRVWALGRRQKGGWWQRCLGSLPVYSQETVCGIKPGLQLEAWVHVWLWGKMPHLPGLELYLWKMVLTLQLPQG
jgi:hypothetical protein